MKKFFSFNQLPIWTDDFFFFPYDKRDEIVICNPQNAVCVSPVFLRSRRSLEEHIQYVNEKHIKKALVVAEDIRFLHQCPELEELHIIPAISAQDFDFSPLYDMPNLRKLCCETIYGPEENRVSFVDYSKFSSLEVLIVNGAKGHNNVGSVKGLKCIAFESGQPIGKTLVGAFQGQQLEELSITQSAITTLDGLDQTPMLKTLKLYYNRRLEDIFGLASVKDSLIELDIESCGKIKDFSVLHELQNLEELRLVGRNVLPDLSFVRNMPNLKSFIFFMNAADGDLSMCLDIPYVSIENHRHYSHKNEDFSKKV